jgi:hypothetical protein
LETERRSADGFGELAEDRHGRLPSHAGVGDALAVDEVLPAVQFLVALDQEAF